MICPKKLPSLNHLHVTLLKVLHYFSDVKYKNEAVLAEAFRLTVASLLHDKEPPVKVEAAIAVQMMLSSKGESARKYLEPQIREITLELLKIIRETENDDLTSVMQKIVCTYTEQLVPVAVDICQHLVGTFAQVRDGVKIRYVSLTISPATANFGLWIICG